MHLTTVRIDRVFSVERRSGRQGKYTEFGFASATSRHYSVNVPGWPAIEAGMEISALLARHGDWESLQGWVNHTSGEVVAPGRGLWIFLLVGGFLLTFSTATAWGNASPFLLYFFFVLPCAFMLFRAIRVRTALETLIAASPERVDAL